MHFLGIVSKWTNWKQKPPFVRRVNYSIKNKLRKHPKLKIFFDRMAGMDRARSTPDLSARGLGQSTTFIANRGLQGGAARF